MENEELPILVKWLRFVEWLFPVTAKFPRSVRHSFATRLENLALDAAEDIIEARYSRDKKVILRRLNVRLEKLRILLRLSFNLHYLAQRSYEHAARQIDEAGQMLSGW